MPLRDAEMLNPAHCHPSVSRPDSEEIVCHVASHIDLSEYILRGIINLPSVKLSCMFARDIDPPTADDRKLTGSSFQDKEFIAMVANSM